MKNKLLSILLSGAIILTAATGILVACNSSGDKTGAAKARDVYAMSAVSSVAYLTADSTATGAKAMAEKATARPDAIAQDDLTGIQNCLDMFDDIIAGGGIDQTIKDNSSTDPLFAEYKFEMTISIPGEKADLSTYTMFFNEIESRTESEIDDDGEDEIEVSTTFEGVLLFGEEIFVVKGSKEVETEGNETETEIEFITYKNVGEGVQADLRNYVLVSQSFEMGEVEYEYVFVKDGKKVQDIELEYEENRRGVEVSFEIKDLSSGQKRETSFKVKKGNASENFIVEFEKNNVKGKITVTKLADGSYKFIYSNGFEEIVGAPTQTATPTNVA